MRVDFSAIEARLRRFLPPVLEERQKKDLNRVQSYIVQFTEYSFAGTQTGDVLQEAVSSRGKMVRPQLVLMAGRFGTSSDIIMERLYKVAALVEMTHLASLIHDDIVDDGTLRRGRSSIQHQYGKSAAVFAGDFLMSRITYYLMKEGFNKSGMVLAKAVEAMCTGEITQALCKYKMDLTIEAYLQNIYGKTAALFRAACHIGAIESGCTPEVRMNLEKLGETLGYMFQMRDDLLDFSPDNRIIGKSSHQDFREGIYTLPVLYACETNEGKKCLHPYMERNATSGLTEKELQEMEQHVMTFGGMEKTWQTIHAYQEQAEYILTTLPDRNAIAPLMQLVRKLGSL